jgi:hypothetical protein
VYADETATPTELIAIDPGDRHIGVAFFGQATPGHWYCQDAQQIDDPDEFEDMLLETLLTDGGVRHVVYERFRLYEDKAQLQKGSEFRTAQMIGVIKFIVRQRHLHVQKHQERQRGILPCELQGGMCKDLPDGPPELTIFGQMADIKKPTAGILRFKKIKSVGKKAKADNKGWGDHAIDAELHGFKYILDVLKEDVAPGF